MKIFSVNALISSRMGLDPSSDSRRSNLEAGGTTAQRIASEPTQAEQLMSARNSRNEFAHSEYLGVRDSARSRSEQYAASSDPIPSVPQTITDNTISVSPEGGDWGEVVSDSLVWGAGGAIVALGSTPNPYAVGAGFLGGFVPNFVSSVDVEITPGTSPNTLVNSTNSHNADSNTTSTSQLYQDGTYVTTHMNHNTGQTVTHHQSAGGGITTTVSTPDIDAASSPVTNVTTTPTGEQITSVTSPTGGTYTASTHAGSDDSNNTSSSDSDGYTPQATQPVANDDGTVTSPTGGTYGPSTPTESNSGGSSGGEGRVICTHFYKKGMFNRDIWRSDLEFTAKYLSPTTVRGYQYWAIPYVKLMRQSQLAEKLMYPLAKHRANELAYQLGRRECGSLRGKAIRLFLEPVCFAIGAVVAQKDWSGLWTDDTLHYRS
ncbi:MAG: hypothetical protein KTR32_07810 [Granulosicoccus sp.]|nr:hypothetical protein [Granulosicoccus sp.]